MVKQIAKWLLKRRLHQPTSEELRLIATLRQRVANLPALEQSTTDSPALAEWIQNRKRLRELVAGDDPRRFLEWDVIRQTMFLGNAPYIPKELASLRASRDWRSRWRPALCENASGLPERCRFDLRSSGNLIHHAYSLHAFEQAVGRTIDRFEYILEFGGGYGSFCRLVHRLGFRGRYVIFDLPEFSALQQFFLESVGVPVNPAQGSSGACCVSEMKDLQKHLEISAEWAFVGLWSLSETPVTLRKEILGNGSNLSAYLVGYQDHFGEVDNITFFADWMSKQKQIGWLSTQIPHMPRSHYMLGAKTEVNTQPGYPYDNTPIASRTGQ